MFKREVFYWSAGGVPPTDMREWKLRWPNFKPTELCCKGTGILRVDTGALDALQRLRTAIGKPLVINSAYRTPAYNAAVGGAKNSQHLYGRAFDISLAGHDREKLTAAAIEAGFTGIGWYNTFVHVDTRPGTKVARWDERTGGKAPPKAKRKPKDV